MSENRRDGGIFLGFISIFKKILLKISSFKSLSPFSINPCVCQIAKNNISKTIIQWIVKQMNSYLPKLMVCKSDLVSG